MQVAQKTHTHMLLMLRLFLLSSVVVLSVLGAAVPVLPPGDYVSVSPPQVLISYKNGGISVAVTQQLLEVLDNGIQAIWSTRMQYFSPQVGTVEALVTLSLVASIAPSGNLLLAVDQCLQNDLESQFTADMCSFFTSSAGCVGNEFVYSQADLGDFVNNTHIAIQGMCGVSSVIVFGCLGEDVCQGTLPGFGPALPAGQYDLAGPAPNFNLPSSSSNPILNGFSLLVAPNNIQIGLGMSLFLENPTPTQGNVTMFGYAFTAPSGQTLFAFSSCSGAVLASLCPSIVSACSSLFTVSQVNLDPSNSTFNDTLLVFSKQFCSLQGATQALCTDAEPCELPINSGANALGFTLQSPCLYFAGRTISFDQSCVTQVVNQTIIYQTVVNQNVTEQTVVEQTVINQNVTNQNITEQTVVDQTVINQTVTSANITDARLNNLYVNFIQGRDGAAVETAVIDQLTVNSITGQIIGYLNAVLYSGPATYTMTMGLFNGIGCTSTGSVSYSVTVQRMGLFVTGLIHLTSGTGVDAGGGNSCNLYGYVSGQHLGLDFRPALLSIGEGTNNFLVDQESNCLCTMIPQVDFTGTLVFSSVNVGSDCCTGGIAYGYQANHHFNSQITLNGGYYSFSYILDGLA